MICQTFRSWNRSRKCNMLELFRKRDL